MHIDAVSVIVGFGSYAFLFLAIPLTVIAFLQHRGPWGIKLAMMVSTLSGLFTMFLVFLLACSYILPDDASVYEQMVAQRPVYLSCLVICVAAAIVFRRLAVEIVRRRAATNANWPWA